MVVRSRSGSQLDHRTVGRLTGVLRTGVSMDRMDVLAARALAHDHLADTLPDRWRHVEQVAAEAERFAALIDLDRRVLVSAAWLHDIGYSPLIDVVGFHPLDGARYLRSEGWPEDVCALVAHHTRARVEAGHRGLADVLCAEFTDQAGPERDALWTADATTGPSGERLSLDQRISEVVERYGVDSVVAECMRANRPELEAAIARTRAGKRPAPANRCRVGLAASVRDRLVGGSTGASGAHPGRSERPT
jgi:putative nucleotidyltransferase with HDIG domain